MQGTFRLGILPTIAPYLLPRFFPQLMKKIPCTGHQGEGDEDARDKGRLLQGDIDAGILAAIDGLEEYAQISLFYERYVGYVSREDPLYARESIRTADVASSGQL